jgi:spermidine synthase
LKENEEQLSQKGKILLLASVFVVAASGLVYELIAGAISSYLLGDAVTQFSLVIGVFLSAMGVGSYLTKFVKKDLLELFVSLELWIALIGGASSILMFAAGAFMEEFFHLVFYGLCILIGALVGAEIPLLIRILKDGDGISDALSNVLALDYIGALMGSLLFPMAVLPWLGLSRASVVFGLLNIVVAWIGIHLINGRQKKKLQGMAIGVFLILIGLLFSSQRLVLFMEDAMYQDDIVYAEDSQYQRIIVTRWRNDVRLYLNGHIQFSSTDEARYHESLVHPPVQSSIHPIKRALVLGGGDGMAVRELLKYDSLEQIVLVDIDPAITKLASKRADIRMLNKDALLSEKLTIHHQDAMVFLRETSDNFDVILIDLPDPNTESLSKLYSTSFYTLVLRRLSVGGVFVTQASSPFFAPKAFWSIVRTIETAGEERKIPEDIWVYPYHVNVPSFGEWGFVMASKHRVDPTKLNIDVDTRFLDSSRIRSLFALGKDLAPVTVEVNRLNQPVLYQYYIEGWRQFND